VAGLAGKAIGRRGAHSVTILGVLVSFLGSAAVLNDVANHGARFNATIYEWMVVGGLKMEIGFLIDGLSAMMMCVVTFVSLMVHIYTIATWPTTTPRQAVPALLSATSRCSPSAC